MHDSNTNNHLLLKAFLLLLVLFVLSTSADFKKRSENRAITKTELCNTLEQQANATLTPIPFIPSFKIKWSFGGENNYLFKKPDFARVLFLEQNIKTEYKLLVYSYLDLKRELKKQAFFTALHKESDIPGYYSA